MLGEALPGGGESHPSSLGLDQPRASFSCQSGDLLRHSRRREVVRLGDRPHRAEPGERRQLSNRPAHWSI